MANITKRELATKITEDLASKGIEITKQDAMNSIQSLIDVITGHLAEGDTVVMRNFGTFHVRELKSKVGRNPKSPEEAIEIPDRARVVFMAGKELKIRVASALPIIQERNNW